MSAFGKVNFVETENSVVESTMEDMAVESVVEKQVEKFDNSFNTDKLQELYAEYDKITIDEEKVKNLTQIKANAISNRVPFRLALGVTTTAIVTLLLVFLCVYNVFVINGMDNSIRYLQEEVISYEQSLVKTEGMYRQLTDPSNIKNELAQMGYADVASSNIVAVSVGEKAEVIELQGETNWFDGVCNFISQIFG
jgi:hypothetical protein